MPSPRIYAREKGSPPTCSVMVKVYTWKRVAMPGTYWSLEGLHYYLITNHQMEQASIADFVMISLPYQTLPT